MVIFHDYVSLPEGKIGILAMFWINTYCIQALIIQPKGRNAAAALSRSAGAGKLSGNTVAFHTVAASWSFCNLGVSENVVYP